MMSKDVYTTHISQVRVVPFILRLWLDMSLDVYTSQVQMVPFVLGTSWDIPGCPKTSALLIGPRSKWSHLSFGHLGMSQDILRRLHFS